MGVDLGIGAAGSTGKKTVANLDRIAHAISQGICDGLQTVLFIQVQLCDAAHAGRNKEALVLDAINCFPGDTE